MRRTSSRASVSSISAPPWLRRRGGRLVRADHARFGDSLLRFNISEIGETLGLEILGNRYVASLLAVVVIAGFAFYEIDGRPAGLALWQLFGTTNQLLAGLALLVVTLYLYERGRNAWVTGDSDGLHVGVDDRRHDRQSERFWAQWDEGGAVLFVVGAGLLVLAVWLTVEAVLRFLEVRRRPRKSELSIRFEEGAS